MSELRDPEDSDRHPPPSSSSSSSTDSDDLLDEETEDDDLPHLMDAANAEAEADFIPGASFVHAPAQPPLDSNNSVAVSCTENKPETEVVDFRPPSPNFLELEGEESGTEEERYRFVKELDRFYREKGVDFRPPKFYGEMLNLLKLWRTVARLGGYERVTVCKLWRQVGEGFKPPKTCTTVSWTFRNFYEKAILEYEKHKIRSGEFQVPASSLGETVVTDKKMNANLLSGSSRARRDSAARAMQGWHYQRLLDNDEDEGPIIKDKNSVSVYKRDKSYGGLKRKRPSSLEGSYTTPRANFVRTQGDSMVVDVGEPADWVKVNVRRTKDCYEVYVLVPGLLREEVHVQSDPCGRLIISGEPEQLDNPWGVAPFKKVITLPSRIDSHQTSAVVTLHGQLFVRAPFEQDF